MAVGINPYRQFAPGQTLIESLWKAQQARRRGQEETTAQMGKISKEFEEELVAVEQKAEEELQKRGGHRKKRPWYQKAIKTLIPIVAGAITGGASSIWMGGLSGAAKARDVYRKGSKDISFARQQARRAKELALSVDPRFGKMFTSRGFTRYTGGAEQKYGGILRQAEGMRKSDVISQALSSGLMAGFQGYTGTKLGGNIGDAWREAAAARGPGKFMSKFGTGEGMLSELFGKQEVGETFKDWSGVGKADLKDMTLEDILESKLPSHGKSRFGKAFSKTGLDMKTLLGEGGDMANALPLILMLLQGMRGE